MSLYKITDKLRKQLKVEENNLTYENARKRNPAFANYTTSSSILVMLCDLSNAEYTQKERIIRALIHEQQSEPHALWISLLLLSYLPMLVQLRNRLRAPALSPDDLDQIVIVSFLQVVQEYSLPRRKSHTCVRLSHQTRRRVFRKLKSEATYQKLVDHRSPDNLSQCELEDRHVLGFQPQNRWDSRDVEELIDLLNETVGDVIDSDKLEMIIATKILRENLRNYLERNGFSPYSTTNERDYQRFKRQRSRALARLRKLGVRSRLLAINAQRVSSKEY